jgi:hypothetical protein
LQEAVAHAAALLTDCAEQLARLKFGSR